MITLPLACLKTAKLTSIFGALQESYESTTKHRKLTWIYGLGSCVLSAHFQKKTMELMLVPFQVVILLLFNSGRGFCTALPQLLLGCLFH